MILKWCIALVSVVSLMVMSLASAAYFTEGNTRVNRTVRNLRVQRQTLEQQLSVLRSPHYAPFVDGLQQEMDALQIQLVELVEEGSNTHGVLSMDYDLRILSTQLESFGGQQISTVRLMLDMAVQHSGNVLAVLGVLEKGSTTWPNELRACQVQRLPSQLLDAQCTIDFYHWQDTGSEGG